MSLAIKITNATFTNFFSSLTLPFRDSLVAEFVIGASQAASVRNRANPASPATLINSPSYAATYATVVDSSSSGNTQGFETGVVPAADCSLIVISTRAPMAIFHTATVGATATGLNQDGTNFSFSNGFTNGATDQAVVAETPPALDSTTFFFQCGVGRIGSVGKLFVGKSGALVSDLATRTDTSRASDTLKIGGILNAAYNTNPSAKVAYAAVFSRLLTDAEVAAAYAQLTAFYANLGIPVN